MFKKYKFPFNLFLIFEKLNPIVYSSNCLTSNHYILLLPKEWYFSVIKCIKNELYFSSSTLIEHSSIDSKKFNNFNNKINLLFQNKRGITYYTFYFYFIKIRLSFLLNISLTESIASIDCLYFNSNWLERENSEMFSINYIYKKDLRNLLLDYSRNEYPLLKEFPCEGYYDVYFDFFDDQLKYIESEFVEL